MERGRDRVIAEAVEYVTALEQAGNETVTASALGQALQESQRAR